MDELIVQNTIWIFRPPSVMSPIKWYLGCKLGSYQNRAGQKKMAAKRAISFWGCTDIAIVI
jgi:hypothetical protein